MSSEVRPADVIMYVNSHQVVGTMPPDARDAVIDGLQQHGYYTFFASGVVGHGGAAGSTVYSGGHFENRPIEGSSLSEDDEKAIDLVWKLVRQHEKTVHIVDVGRETGFHRYIEEHRHHLKQFPVLVRPDGRRLEGIGQFTDENLEVFLRD
jgi:hypothetical protein